LCIPLPTTLPEAQIHPQNGYRAADGETVELEGMSGISGAPPEGPSCIRLASLASVLVGVRALAFAAINNNVLPAQNSHLAGVRLPSGALMRL
jgi:hypothetical protein